jgi:outer membrane protein assembly factor BamB
MRGFQAAIMLCVILVGSPVRAEWGTTQGDAAHSGYVPMTVSAAPPTLLWSTPGTLIHSSLAVGGGNLYFVTHTAGTGWADNLYAVDEHSGVVNLHVKMDSNTRTGDPAYANGVVYLQSVNTQSLVTGWNVQTQAQVFSAPYANQGNIYRAPVISNGSLYAGGGYYGGQVYSYNTADSSVNWVSSVPYGGSYSDWTPAVDANQVYAATRGGSDLVILDRTTGAFLSETGPQQETGSSSPMLTGNGGLFYVENGIGHYIDVTDPTSQHEIWSRTGLNAQIDPAYANGTIYIASSPTALYALDAATGLEKWSLTGVGAGQNLIVTDNVLFATQLNKTVAISLETHQALWSVPIGGVLAVSDNELFIGNDGNVAAYRIAVPEPSSVLLLSIGAAGLLVHRRPRRS